MSSHAEIGDNHIEEKRATENVSILSSLNVNESSMCAPRAESRFHFCFSWHYFTRCDRESRCLMWLIFVWHRSQIAWNDWLRVPKIVSLFLWNCYNKRRNLKKKRKLWLCQRIDWIHNNNFDCMPSINDLLRDLKRLRPQIVPPSRWNASQRLVVRF